MNLFDMLKADKDIPVSDPMARLWGYQYQQKHGVSEISGVPPLHFTSRGEHLLDYRIYGNTVQDGTPAPENPVEVQGCGEYDAELNGYKIPVTVAVNLAPPYTEFIPGFMDSNGYRIQPDEIRQEKISTFVSVSPNKRYEFSFNGGTFPEKENRTPWRAVALYDTNKKFIIRDSAYIRNPLIFSTTADTAYVRVSYRSYGSTENTLLIDTANSVTTPVYIGSEPLHKIGDYADYVDFKRGVVVRRIKKLVLTGEEGWTITSNGVLRIGLSGQLRLSTPLCTHYLGSNSTAWSNVPDKSVTVSISGYFAILDTTYTAAADFKSYLAAQYAAGTPVTVWYVLATPEEEPLENLLPIQTIKGTNVLTVDTTVQPSNIWIKGKIKAID